MTLILLLLPPRPIPFLHLLLLQAASSTETKGKISGYLIYPSNFIPEDLGVCAQRIDNQSLVFCTEQIKDKKYQNGVGYEMSLDPGNYYVYSFLGDNRAYYTEFVLCGLKAECQSHTKIPVTVSAGSSQDNILPHDWYDFGPTETDQPLPSSTIAPTATSVPIIPIVSIKIDKDIIMKIAPTATPTPKALVIPSVKIKIPELSW